MAALAFMWAASIQTLRSLFVSFLNILAYVVPNRASVTGLALFL